jgi:hypothetical protein
MSRHRSSRSKSHWVERISSDHYRLHWVVDRYYSWSNLRHPRSYRRDTDEAGAKRFAKRWNVEIPNPGYSSVRAERREQASQSGESKETNS